MSTRAVSSGFTLIELSIVLVIIGLIVGGVLAGSSLIQAARLRKVATEYSQIQVAVMTFYGKYSAYPGDMPNATTIWGTNPNGCPANGISTYSTQVQVATCDGNGDGLIGVPGSMEMWLFWQHLADAGLVPGQYTGVTGPTGGGANAVIGLNTPPSAYSASTGWGVMYNSAQGGGDGINFPNPTLNRLFFGSVYLDDWILAPSLSTAEAQQLDLKLDDGKPGTGKVYTVINGAVIAPNCATTTDANTAAYDLTQSGPQCLIIFDGGF